MMAGHQPTFLVTCNTSHYIPDSIFFLYGFWEISKYTYWTCIWDEEISSFKKDKIAVSGYEAWDSDPNTRRGRGGNVGLCPPCKGKESQSRTDLHWLGKSVLTDMSCHPTCCFIHRDNIAVVLCVHVCA